MNVFTIPRTSYELRRTDAMKEAAAARIDTRVPIESTNSTLVENQRMQTTSTCTGSEEILSLCAQNETLLQQVEKAICTMDDSKKRAFLQAQETAPELLKEESDYLKFLRYHKFDVQAAAEGVVIYWERRRKLFKERAFLPMKPTADGAPFPDDIPVLRSGFVAILPNDDIGRPVMCFDRSRLLKGTRFDDSRLRCMFYLFSVVSNDPKAQDEGIIVLRLMQALSVRFNLESFLEILEVSTIRVASLEMFFVSNEPGASRIIESTLIPAACQSLPDNMSECTHCHLFEPKRMDDLQREVMERCCLSRDVLPESLGGDWKYSEFEEWVQHQVNGIDDVGNDESKMKPRGRLDILGAAASRALQQELTIEEKSDETHESNLGLPTGTNPVLEAVHLIPEQKKQAFRRVLSLRPELIEQDTDPALFLQASGSDPVAAAQLLVANWEKRSELFNERCFFPMSQTGEGTLGRNDIRVLSHGVFHVLVTESTQPTYIFFDVSKASDYSQESVRRVAFYMFGIAAEDAAARKHGVVLVTPVESQDHISLVKVRFADILDVMPFQVSSVLIYCSHPQEGHSRRPSRQEVSRWATSIFGSSVEHCVRIQDVVQRSDAAIDLQKRGLALWNLPKSIGGDWGVQKWTEWQELRTRLEWSLPPASCHKGIDKIFDFTKVMPPSRLSEAEKLERSRRMNVLHSRRKRERERIEIAVLQEQCGDLTSKNGLLRRENSHFESVLNVALEKIRDGVRGDEMQVYTFDDRQTAMVQSKRTKKHRTTTCQASHTALANHYHAMPERDQRASATGIPVVNAVCIPAVANPPLPSMLDQTALLSTMPAPPTLPDARAFLDFRYENPLLSLGVTNMELVEQRIALERLSMLKELQIRDVLMRGQSQLLPPDLLGGVSPLLLRLQGELASHAMGWNVGSTNVSDGAQSLSLYRASQNDHGPSRPPKPPG